MIFFKLLKGALIVVGLLVGAGVLLFFVVGKPYRMPSASMEPTLHCARPGIGCGARFQDRFLALRWIPFGRGDIVVFKTPPAAAARCGAGGTFVKRVIGLPGDRVVERNGIVFVNGNRLAEPYVSASRRDHAPSRSWKVPQGSYFLLGDNRAQSCDSRFFGAVPKGDIVGRVIVRYWPPNRIGRP